jgi:beta-galactosidase
MEVKSLTGFSYLPRQDSPNGNIKDYEILVSTDGTNWSEPVSKGSFANNQNIKKVMFEQPVKARYLRFRALSNQAGNDYATGAEFKIMAE